MQGISPLHEKRALGGMDMNYIIRGPYIKALNEVKSIVGVNICTSIDSSVFDNNMASELMNKIDYKPDTNKRYIVFEKANALAVPMQNKLLKSIEEGREFNSFIFLSSRLLLIPTIQSRCVIKKVNVITAEDVKEYAQSHNIELINPKAIYAAVENNSDNIDFYLANQEYFSKIYAGLLSDKNLIKLFDLGNSKNFDVQLIHGSIELVYYRIVAELMKTGRYSEIAGFIEQNYRKVNTLNDFTHFICKLQLMLKEEVKNVI